jgi:hypothetical protein
LLILLLSFFFVSLAYSEDFKCPDGALLMEYQLPEGKKVKKTCGFFQSGKVIKHGPEVVTSAGKVIEETYYKNGEETSLPSKIVENKDMELEQVFKSLRELLSILSYDQGRMNHGQFNVGGCDPRPFDWVVAALKKNDIPKTYSFSEKCDVSGSFTASFKRNFPVDFNLRNLNGLTQSHMKIKMISKKGTVGIRYRFEVLEGTISSSQNSYSFKAEYEVDINPQNGHAIFSTQKGSVSIIEANKKSISFNRELMF